MKNLALIIKAIYMTPVMPIIIFIAVKEAFNPWYSAGKVSKETQEYIDKNSRKMQLLAFVVWIAIILTFI